MQEIGHLLPRALTVSVTHTHLLAEHPPRDLELRGACLGLGDT